jgi:hypothetical protein
MQPPPGRRWTGDRGAIPGEPAYILDANEHGDGPAALIEHETPKGSRWEAALDTGKSLGVYDSLPDAAERAEKWVDRVTKRAARSLFGQA